jgi:hypothetical protein
VERLLRRSSKETEDAASARQLSGTYSRSTGFEGHTLQLNAEGTFKYGGQSDAIDMCTMGRWTFEGAFHLEEGYLAIEPGPSMKRYGIDAPDLLKPVAVGDRHYLVEESQLVDFWRLEKEGRLPTNNRFFYVRSTSEASVHSMSGASAACADRE